MRSAKDFFKPLAIGAPEPLREIPFRPSRVIHFFPPQLEKVVAKLPEVIPTVDIILGNLEDAIPMADKEAARRGFINVAKTVPMGDTQLWTRVNSLDSPWFLDDMNAIVTEAGDKVDVIMIPKVEGPEDIHYVDRLLAQLEAKAGLKRPILIHALLETARASIVSSQAAVKAAETALAGTRAEARVGQRTTLDVLNAQQALLNARVTLVSAQRDRVVASYTALGAIGRLSARQLDLGVAYYDLATHFEQVNSKWSGSDTPDGR